MKVKELNGVTYSRSVTLTYPNGTDTVYFPDLTPEERAIREKIRYDAAVRFLKAVERTKMQKKKQEEEAANVKL